MACVSFSRSPLAPDVFSRSLPARSIKFSIPAAHHPCLQHTVFSPFLPDKSLLMLRGSHPSSINSIGPVLMRHALARLHAQDFCPVATT